MAGFNRAKFNRARFNLLYPVAETKKSSDTLLLRFGAEDMKWWVSSADTLLFSADTLLFDPAIESVTPVATLTGTDTLLFAPDYDDVFFIGNTIGACEATVRAIHGRVKITYSDPALNEAITITATDTAYGTDVNDTADNLTGAEYKWFSLQENDLSGDYHPMPAASVGWWSNTQSDANGAFSPGVVVTVVMEDARPIYDLKLCGDDQLNNFPVDFEIKLYDASSVLLHTETVTANTLWDWSKTLTTYVNAVKTMEVTITKISQPNRSAIVTEFFTAYAETYEDSDIFYMSLLEERDYTGGTLPIGNVSANEITIRLNNIDQHFSVDNENSPIYNLMKKNRRIEAWLGIETPYGGDITWEPLGVFWSQDWSTPIGEPYAETVGFDRLESLRNTEFYSSQIYEDYTLTQLATLVFSDAGLLASEYDIDPALDSIVIPYAWFGRTTHREALVEIAEACSGTAFVDRDGKIIITPYADQTLPSYTLSPDQYYSKDSPLAFSEIVNYVEVRATPRVLGTASEIYNDSESITVPAGGTATQFCIFSTDDPCTTIQTAVFTQSGADITLTAQVDYTWASELTFSNAGGTDQTVDTISITGTPLETSGEKIAVATDDNSIRLNGKQALQTPVENAFIQSKARAQAIADAILAAYKDPRRDVVVDARGYTISRIGERMTVQSVDTATSNDYTITRQQVEYDGGLKIEMTGQKIPDV